MKLIPALASALVLALLAGGLTGAQEPPPQKTAEPQAQQQQGQQEGQQQQQPAQQPQQGQQQPEQAAAPPPLSAAGQASLQQAKDAFKAGKWQDALAASQKVLAEQPKNWDALYIAGACERQNNDLAAAYGHLKTLVEDSPRFPFAHFQLGYVDFLEAGVLTRDGKADQAKAKYSEAADAFAGELALKPDNLASTSSRAVALARAGRVDEAIAAHEAWIKLTPDKNEPYVSLAATYALAGKPSDAMATLDRLPVKDAKSVFDAATAVANVFSTRDHWGAAVPFAEKAVQVNPTSTTARTLLTQAYARALHFDDAVASLKILLTMNPSPEEAEKAGDAIKATIGDGKSSVSLPGVDPPTKVRLPEPRYPKGQDTSVETTIYILAHISPANQVSETVLIPNRIYKDMETSGFVQEAKDAVERGKFLAGSKDGKPTAMWLTVPVKFTGIR